MRHRIVTAVASVLGAAAVVAVPVALVAPAQGAPILASQHEPTTWPNTPEANNVGFWEDFLEDRGYENVVCVKDEITGNESDEAWTVPPLADEDRFYVLAVVKGGSGEEANRLYWRPVAGQVLTHPSAGISHVILCTAEEVETTTPPTTTTTTTTKPPTTTTTPPTTTTTTHTPPKTGPVVETDRPSDGGSGLGTLAAGGALIVAGVGAALLARRRQGDHL
jgi:hypothetical protein